MKKVAIIGTAGVPARYGGFETLVHHLVHQLNDQFQLSVYCSTKYYAKEERVKEWNKAKLVHIPLNANGAQSIPYDIWSIIHALFYADVLLILGVSGGIILPLVKLFTRKKIVVNIDGLEWRREKWSLPIRKFLKFSEYLAVKCSDIDITDNEAIKRYTARSYKTLSYLIEYGADHVSKRSLQYHDYKKYPFLKNPYAFKVARIEPENNIHLVLKAFDQIKNRTLVMVGNWNNSAYGQALKEEYQYKHNLYLLDPIYDQEALDKLRSNCQVYVHGHSAGGTNPSLVEAMYLGLPIISFDVSYNRATTENKALFFKNETELAKVLHRTNEEQLVALGEEMKSIADRRYRWEAIAGKYAQLIYSFDYKYSKKSIMSKMSKVNYEVLQGQGLAHLKNPSLFFEED